MISILILIAVQYAILIASKYRSGIFRLRGLGVAVNMILIAIYAPVMIDWGIGVSNLTNVCFAGVVAAQCVILERGGVAAARISIWVVHGSLMMVFLAGLAITLVPSLDGHQVMNDALIVVSQRTPEVVIASFVTFFVAMEIMFRVWARARPQLGFVGATLVSSVACQAIDTPLFFLIAFSGRFSDISVMSEIIAVGFLVKSGLAVVLLPAACIACVREASGRLPPICISCARAQNISHRM